MRKIIFFLFISLLIMSCTSNDIQIINEDKLHLSVEHSTSIEGDLVYFTVLDNSSVEVNAQLYTDDNLISNPFKFTKKGTYKITAKKKGYENSNSIEVTVIKKPRKNNVSTTKQHYDIKSVSMSVEQISKIDYEASKEYYVDKAIRLPNGKWYNIYHIDIRINGNTGYERFEVCYYVPNKTIVAKDNEIIDYGQRVLPNEVDSKEIIYHDSWIVVDDYDATRNWETAKSEIDIEVEDFENKGIGAGYLGLDIIASFEIVYKDGNTPINIVYEGVVRFCEKTENVSDF